MKPKSDKLEEKLVKTINRFLKEYGLVQTIPAIKKGSHAHLHLSLGQAHPLIQALTKLILEEKREAWQEGVEFAAMGLTTLSQARVHKIPGMNGDKLARAMREALKDGSDETDR